MVEKTKRMLADFMEKTVLNKLGETIDFTTDMKFYDENDGDLATCELYLHGRYLMKMTLSFSCNSVVAITNTNISLSQIYRTVKECKEIIVAICETLRDKKVSSFAFTEQPTKEEQEQPTEETAEQERPTYIDTDTVSNTWEAQNKRLSEKYGENYCIGNVYPDVPKVNPYLVRAWHYRADLASYRRYYSNPNRYEKPSWSKGVDKDKLTVTKVHVYRAFKQMVKDAYLYKNTIERLLSVHSYLMKLYQKEKITIDEYRFYTNKLENMYNDCLR